MLTPLLLLLTLLLILASLRALYILRRVGGSRLGISQPPSSHKRTAHILISLGSGGHTAEMLALLSSPALPTTRYTRRTYVISSGDAFSAEKAREFEAGLLLAAGQDGGRQEEGGKQTTGQQGERQQRRAAPAPAHPGGGGYEIHTVPRARRIHQPLHTTPWTCLICLWSCIRVLLGRAQNDARVGSTTTTSSVTEHQGWGKPDLILLNGPATSLILVLASLLIRFFSFSFSVLPQRIIKGSDDGGGKMRTIYIESWARVRTPSLTLRIISSLRLCDRVVVQHQPLARAEWGEWRGDMMR